MDGGAWWAAVNGVTKSWTRLSEFTSTFHFPALEKEMATHSSILAWRISGTGEPVGCHLWGRHRVGHDSSNLAAAAAGHSRTLGSWPLMLVVPNNPCMTLHCCRQSCDMEKACLSLNESCFSRTVKEKENQWHPTPVLVSGKSHGRRSLVGCSPWCR